MKKFIKLGYKILLAASGAGSVGLGVAAFDPTGITLGVTGVTAIASAVSSAVKDKKVKPVMSLVNAVACNFDNAKNDDIVNS